MVDSRSQRKPNTGLDSRISQESIHRMTPAQKLAVAKMSGLNLEPIGGVWMWKLDRYQSEVKGSEWLYICHCAEGKLTDEQHDRFRAELKRIIITAIMAEVGTVS